MNVTEYECLIIFCKLALRPLYPLPILANFDKLSVVFPTEVGANRSLFEKRIGSQAARLQSTKIGRVYTCLIQAMPRSVGSVYGEIFCIVNKDSVQRCMTEEFGWYPLCIVYNRFAM